MSGRKFGEALEFRCADPAVGEHLARLNQAVAKYNGNVQFHQRNQAELAALETQLAAVVEKLTWPLSADDRASLLAEQSVICRRVHILAGYLTRLCENDRRNLCEMIAAQIGIISNPAVPMEAADKFAFDIHWLRVRGLCPDDQWAQAVAAWPWLRVPSHYREEAAQVEQQPET
jgi:hypothetical protein